MIFNELAKVFFLGLIQGLSEFLPISSSGHLVVLDTFFKSDFFDLFFILVLHLGTLAAILGFYRKELLNIVKNSLANKSFSLSQSFSDGSVRLLLLLGVASLPGVIGAFYLMPLIKKSLQNIYWTGAGFLLTATYIFFTRFPLKKTPGHKENNINEWKDFSFISAFIIGLAQVLAFFPGMSRSGLTIATALFLGQSQKKAAFFSFLMAIPAILGGIVFEYSKEEVSLNNSSFLLLSIAFFSSWFFGHLALKWLICSLHNFLFPYFAIYLWALGIFLLIY